MDKAEKICERLELGEPLSTICKDKDFPETIIYTDKERIACTGETNDHPRVYYTVPEVGFVVCGYCDIKFARKKPDELSG